MTIFLTIIERDLLLGWRRRTDVLTTVIFFVIVVSLFPLSISPDSENLKMNGAGIVWVAALLATTLGLMRLFSKDVEDGTLEQMALAPESLTIMALAKIIAHWCMSGLPLVLLSPILALQFGLSGGAVWTLFLSLLLGTPILSLIGAIGAALTLNTRGSGMLMALIVLPLYIPVLIFGAGAVGAEMSGVGASANFMLLGGILLASLVLAPWATAAALRIALE